MHRCTEALDLNQSKHRYDESWKSWASKLNQIYDRKSVTISGRLCKWFMLLDQSLPDLVSGFWRHLEKMISRVVGSSPRSDDMAWAGLTE